MNYERMLRRIRSHPALWGEAGPAKEKQAERIRDKCKAKLSTEWDKRPDYAGQRMLYMYA